MFRGHFGDDTIADFDARPANGQDKIDLRPLGITEETFDDLVTITVSGGATRVGIADAGTILCPGIDGEGGNAITIQDFILL